MDGYALDVDIINVEGGITTMDTMGHHHDDWNTIAARLFFPISAIMQIVLSDFSLSRPTLAAI